MHAAGAEIGGMEARPAGALIEAHQLLALLEPPEKRRHRADIDGEGRQVQKVVQDPADLTIENTDILATARHFDTYGALDGQRPGMLLIHRRHIVQAVEIGKRLKIGLMLDQLFGAAMKKADMRVGPLDDLAIHFQHKAQHTMGRRVLGPEIHRDRLDLHFRHDRPLTRPWLLFRRPGSAPACLPTGSGSRNRGIPEPATQVR